MTNMQNNTDENFNEDFERLLKQFVSEKYKDVKLDDMQTEDDEDSFLEDEDVNEDVDEYYDQPGALRQEYRTCNTDGNACDQQSYADYSIDSQMGRFSVEQTKGNSQRDEQQGCGCNGTVGRNLISVCIKAGESTCYDISECSNYQNQNQPCKHGKAYF